MRMFIGFKGSLVVKGRLFVMSEKIKPTIEDLQKRIQSMEQTARMYRAQLEETIRSKPLQSVGLIFVGGFVLGILLGVAVSRRK